MTETERSLVSAVRSYLFEDAAVSSTGNAATTAPAVSGTDDADTYSHEHTKNRLRDEFAAKVASLSAYTPICAAFAKAHDHLPITDPSFPGFLTNELKAMGVAVDEQQKATRAVAAVISANGGGDWSDRDLPAAERIDTAMECREIAPDAGARSAQNTNNQDGTVTGKVKRKRRIANFLGGDLRPSTTIGGS